MKPWKVRLLFGLAVAVPIAAFVGLEIAGKTLVDSLEVAGALLAGSGTTASAWFAATAAIASLESTRHSEEALAYAVRPVLEVDVRDHFDQPHRYGPTHAQRGFVTNTGELQALDVEATWHMKVGPPVTESADVLEPGFEFFADLGVTTVATQGWSAVDRVVVRFTDSLSGKRWQGDGRDLGVRWNLKGMPPTDHNIEWNVRPYAR